MRVLVVGAGVVGSVYAARLAGSGHPVTLVARQRRRADLDANGLVLHDAATGRVERRRDVGVVGAPADLDGPVDLVLVAVGHDQLDGVLPLLDDVRADVLFLGNTAGRVRALRDALGGRALFGFPAVAGVRDGEVVRFVTIRQQRTMLAAAGPDEVARTGPVAAAFRGAGFPVQRSADAEGWLLAHAAFVVPMALGLARVDTDPARLARDRRLLELVVRATAEAFTVLRDHGNREIPGNLRALYLRLPRVLAVAYWRRVLAGPRGELWFAAHTRAAPAEHRSLGAALREQLGPGRAPALAELTGA